MDKILNTLKYGSATVKRDLIITILSGLTAIGMLISAIITGQMLLFFVAIIFAFITISMVQTFRIHSMDEEVKQNFDDNSENLSGNKSLGKKKASKSTTNHAADNSSSIGKKGKKEKIDDNSSKDLEDNFADEIDSANENIDKEAYADNQSVHTEKVTKVLSIETAKNYNKKVIKKVVHKYKVKRDHRKVIVDNCKSLKISQTPAFAWIANKEFNLLLLESEPRHLTFPLYSLRNIRYMKKQPANPEIEYPAFESKNMISDMFGELLPDYVHSTVVGDVSAYKNLYCIGSDICFTNRSAGSLFDLLGVEFVVEDKVTTSNKVNVYFKDAYKANIMLRDNVIDANGYADKISTILDGMARSTISYNEFKDTLNLMIRNKLITQEFATHFMGVRDDLSSK
ncbi:MAG: hypothetical protein PUG10_11115 [Lachnospiraceae bacterium]|nr:hypothetical protein [Lachnospiraceae bacterium]